MTWTSSVGGNDAHRFGVRPADRDGHAPDADGDRIAAQRTAVQRFNRNALVKPEMLESRRFCLLKTIPINGSDHRPRPKGELVETQALGMERRIHYCE